MLTICELPTFIADADKLLTKQELDDLKSLLAADPEIGDLIPGTGGLRKLRQGLTYQGKGKRSGARVIYYYHSEQYPLALIALYAKGEKIDLSAAEKKELRKLAKAYTEAFDAQHEGSTGKAG